MASRASLNHTYRTVWNAALGSMVAVAETAPSHAGGTSCVSVCAGASTAIYRVAGLTALSLGIALGLGGWVASAHANPTGAVAIMGQASLATQGNKLTVTTQNGLGLNHSAINWQSFSIPAGSSTHFQQPSATSTSINRVVSNTPSQIFGTLSSNGRLFLVNQSGITVGAGAVVDTAGFTASSLRMSDADALAGRLRFGDATVSGAALNVQGSILARTADAVLIGSNLEVGREALIQAPNGSTLLAAGQQVELTGPGLEGIRLQVQAPTDRALNLGTLQGDAVGIFAGTLRHSGQVRADAVTVEGGRVVLKAGSQLAVDGQATAQALGQKGGSIHATAPEVHIESTALLDASGPAGGGEVLVGGGFQGQDPRLVNAFSSQIDSGAQLRADATGQGNGGTVVVWADDTARVHGSLSARGGPQGGDGGLIETSGKRLLSVTQPADASAPRGRAGTWLLDPQNVEVNSFGSGANPLTSYLAAGTISAALNSGTSVTITTSAQGSQSGDITIASPITKVSGVDSSLTLNAHNNVDIQANVTGSSTGGKLNLVLNPDSDRDGLGGTYVGGYTAAPVVQVQQLISAGYLEISGGDMTVQGSAQSTGTVALYGGNLNLNGAAALGNVTIVSGSLGGTGSIGVSGVFSQTGGTLGGSGTLTLNGNANTWSGGSWTGGGTTVLAPDAALTLGNTYYFSPNMDGRTLQINSGATATIQRELGVIGGDNTIDVKSGGTLQFSPFNTGYGGAVTSSGIVTSGTGALTIANAGSVVVQPGTNAYLDSYVDPVSHPGVLFTVNSPGAVTVGDGGSLDLYSSYGPQAMSASLAGALAVGTGATLSNNGAVLNISPASVTTPGYSFSGTLAAYNGDTVLTVPTGNTANIGAINISGGALMINGDASTPAFSQSSGVFSGSGTLTLNGNANTWSGGSWTGGGTTVLAPGAALTLGNTYYFSPNMDGRTLQINSGATATIQRELGVIGGDNTIDVKSGGTLQFSPFNTGYGGSVTSSGIVTSGTGALTIANAGSIVVQPGTSAYLDSYVDPVSHPGVLFTVNSPGAVTVGDGGSLDLYSSYGPQAMSVSLAGALAVGTGATLSNNGAVLNITPPDSASLGATLGSLVSNGGTTTLNLANAGNPTLGALAINGGTVTLTGEASTGSLNQTDGSLVGTGTLTLNEGTHNWSGGSWGGGGVTQLAPNATLTIVEVPGAPTLEGRTLNIGSSALADVQGELTVNGGLNQINVSTGGTLRFSQSNPGYGGSVYSGIASYGDGALSINNAGGIQVQAGTSAYLESYVDPSVQPSVYFLLNSTGTVNIGSGAALDFYSASSPLGVNASLSGALTLGSEARLGNLGATLNIAPPDASSIGAASGGLMSTGGFTSLNFTTAGTPSLGTLEIYGGTVTFTGGASTASLSQTGGSLVGGGSLTIVEGFNQSAGLIELGNFSATQSSGQMSVAGRISTTGNLELAAPAGGLNIASTANLLSNGGSINLTGTGGSLSTGNQVGVFIAGSVEAGNGNISVSGTAGGSLGDNNDGIRLASTSSLQSSSASLSAINLYGVGGANGASDNDGLEMYGTVRVNGPASGGIQISGQGGGTPGTGHSLNGGVYNAGTISTELGRIQIFGSGGQGDSRNRGVRMANTSVITSTHGAINVTGNSGPGTGNLNEGIRLLGQLSTGSPSSSGIPAVNLLGVSLASSGDSENGGVHIGGTVRVTGAGGLRITGTGGGTTSNNTGVTITGLLESTQGANIEVTGIGGGINLNISNPPAGTGFNDGVYVGSPTGVKTITAGTGSVIINGTRGYGVGVSNRGVRLDFGSLVQTTSGDISILGNASALGSGGSSTDGTGVSLGGRVLTQSGNIDIFGVGSGNPDGDSHRGVDALGPVEITTQSGSISIEGLAGAGFNFGRGVSLDEAPDYTSPSVVSSTGSVSIIGVRNSGAAGLLNDGVYLGPNARVESGASSSTQVPAISITGAGASLGADSYNRGVHLEGGIVRTSGAGSLVISGTGGGFGEGNVGVSLNNAALESNSGNISVTGVGAGEGNDNAGVYVNNGTIRSVAGGIVLQGTGSSMGGTGSHGVVLSDPVIRARSSIIDITGNVGNNYAPETEGLYVWGAAFELGTAAQATLQGSSFLNDGQLNLSGYTYTDPPQAMVTETGGQVTLQFPGAPAHNANVIVTNGVDLALSGGARAGSGTQLINSGTNGAPGNILVTSGTLRVPSGASLNNPADASVTFGQEGQLDGSGSLNNSGFLSLGGAASIGQFVLAGGQLTGVGSLTVRDSFSMTGGTIANSLSSIDITQTEGDLMVGDLHAQNSLSLHSAAGSIYINGSVSSQGTVRASARGGSLTIGSDGYGGYVGSVTAAGAGDAVVLSTDHNFINQAGTGALNTPNGRWLVYSTSPLNDTRGGLTYGFKHYGLSPGVNGYGGPGIGNGLIYSVAPVLTAGLGGAVSKVYDGNNSAPLAGLNVTTSGAIDNDTVQLAVNTANYADPGASNNKFFTAQVGVAGASNGTASVYGYQLTNSELSSNFGVISQRPITVKADDKSKVYGTTDPALSYTVTAGSLVGGDSLSGSLSRTAGENAGTYTIDASALGNGNYLVTANNGQLTISKAHLTVAANDASKVYGDANPAFTTTLSGFVNGDSLSSAGISGVASTSSAATASTGAGTAVITASAGTLSAPNYDFTQTVNGTLTITKRPITVSADDKTRVYGDTNPVLTYAVAPDGTGSSRGLVNGDLLSGGPSTTAGTGTGVGNYAISATGLSNANYQITANSGTLTISQRPITAKADDKSRVYGDANPALTYTVAPDGTGSSRGLVNGDLLSGSLSTTAASTTGVGNYTISATGLSNANYQVTANSGTLTISQRPITVKADDKSRDYGDANPALTYTVAPDGTGGSRGLVNGDVLSGTLATVASVGSAVGNYPITATTLSNANYQITTNPGTLAVGQRSVANWTAGAVSGLWNDSENWDAVPTAANVRSVVIPAGATVAYEASAGVTQVQTITSSGTLSVAGGSLNISSSLTTAQYNQNGGALGGTGSLVVMNSFSQSGGTIDVGGAVSINQATGNLQVGSITAPSISLSATAGSISQVAGLVTTGLLETRSAGSTVLNSTGNRVASFVGNVSGTGNLELTSVGTIDVKGIESQSGNIIVSNTGGISTSGAVVARAGSVDMTANSPLTVGQPGIQASGNITLTATNLTSAGNMTLQGNLNATGGSITLNAASGFTQNGTLTAPLGIYASAGQFINFGPLASSVGDPVVYMLNGVAVSPPGARTSAPQMNVVSEFLQKFEDALVSEELAAVAVDDTKEKKRAKGLVVVEALSCPR